MKSKFGSKKLVGIFISLLIALAACSSGTSDTATETTVTSENGNEDDRYGGTLRVVVGESIVNIGLPHLIRARGDVVVSNTAYETLGRYNASGEPEPWLAEGWEANPEEKTITVTLKQGITFHDGSDFNAEAVKWNLEMYRDANRSEAAALDTIEVLDEYKLQLNLTYWDTNIFSTLFCNAAMASLTAYNEKGEEWLQNNPVGTGPFVFSEWIRDEKVTFVRNENYWIEGQPYLDAVEFQTIGETSTAEAAMIAGDFDIYMMVSARVANNLANQFQIEVLENGMGAVGLSMAPDSINPDSPLADVKVRKAIGHAIDKQALIDAVYYGYGQPVEQWAVPSLPKYNPEVEGTPYDPEKSKQLLQEAGYGDGLDLTLTVRNDPTLVQLFTAIQGFLAEVGINAELNIVPIAEWQEMTAKDGTWKGIIFSNFRVDNDVIFDVNRGLSKHSPLYSQVYLDEEVEELLEQAANVTTAEEYLEISRQVQKLTFDKYQASIPLIVEDMLLAQTGKVHDHGFMKTFLTQWSPESVWIEK